MHPLQSQLSNQSASAAKSLANDDQGRFLRRRSEGFIAHQERKAASFKTVFDAAEDEKSVVVVAKSTANSPNRRTDQSKDTAREDAETLSSETDITATAPTTTQDALTEGRQAQPAVAIVNVTGRTDVLPETAQLPGITFSLMGDKSESSLPLSPSQAVNSTHPLGTKQGVEWSNFETPRTAQISALVTASNSHGMDTHAPQIRNGGAGAIDVPHHFGGSGGQQAALLGRAELKQTPQINETRSYPNMIGQIQPPARELPAHISLASMGSKTEPSLSHLTNPMQSGQPTKSIPSPGSSIALTMPPAGPIQQVSENIFKLTGSTKEFLAVSSTEFAATQSPQMSVTPQRSELPLHIARQLAEVAQHLPSRPVEITLSPEELGRVRLSVTPAERGIVVNVLAERPETLDLMRRHIDDLAQEFQGLGYEAITFSFSDAERNASDEKGEQSPENLKDHTLRDHDNDAPQSTHIHLTTGASTGLDLRL